MKHYEDMKSKTLKNYKDFSSFANAHLYYGFHQTNDGWFYREWAPNADSLSLIGDFNNWNRKSHLLRKLVLVIGKYLFLAKIAYLTNQR